MNLSESHLKLGTKIALIYTALGILLLLAAVLIWLLPSDFILIIVLGLLAIAVAAYWIARHLNKSLKQLGEGAKIISQGNLDFRLNITSGDEIEQLARAFNEMADQLKESYIKLEGKNKERTGEISAQRDQLDQTAKKLIEQNTALSEVREKGKQALEEATLAKKKAEEARLATLNILEDIEEARRAQEVEKNKVEAVLRSLTDGILMLDQSGRIALVNNKATSILNIGAEEIFDKKLEDIDGASFKKIKDLLKAGKGQIEKGEITIEEPSEMILEINTASVLDADKKLVLGQLIILHDITREKAIERMKSEFVTIAAHQLRTPLSAVKWTLRLILDGDMGPVNKEQADILQKGYQSNERMIVLINDLLNVARIEEGRFIYGFSEISFNELIFEILSDYQGLIKIKNLSIKFEKPEKDCRAKADKEKMKLAVQNLIENAIHYSSPGSTVTIMLNCDKMNLSFCVRDQGIGIPATQHSRIFGKFFRAQNAMKTETEGTGLGLFITKNIVESHGGKIWFESEESKGTTFYFTIPIK